MKLAEKIIIILIVFLLGISYFPTKWAFAEDKLKFSTQQTRELWQVCAVSFRNLNPGIGQNIYFPVCDCYVDYIRSNHTPKEVMGDNPNSMGMSKEEYGKLSQNLRKTCNPQKQSEENFTKWEYPLKTFPIKS